MVGKFAQEKPGESKTAVQDVKKTPHYQPTRAEKNLSNAYAYILSLVKSLRHTDPKIREKSLIRLEKYMQPLGILVNTIIRGASNVSRLAKVADTLDEMGEYDLANKIDKALKRVDATNIPSLVKLANHMDNMGFHKLADKIDKNLDQAEYGFFPRERKSEEEEETVEPVQPPRLGSLSTRYCPDHIGVQSVRISDRIYQCPIDGMVYNYESGYKNYQGQRVPGGSVAAQTPTTSNYGGIPMRIYDSRQSVLNRVN